ncbi:MAG: tRNA (guanosine(46)-N7)-methyltransferase TrmB [Gammaproteobacteria bacterium]|nr:tRNA (guanosine(46)-N7)-methyltransferase TrmB [Gammaproteobacteria bacterium]
MQDQKVHLRPIRSFVRRAGRVTPSQRQALQELWPAMGLEYGDEVLDFKAIFGRDSAVVLEIGFGDGETLVLQAAENPDFDYLGIEVHEAGVGHCLLKARDAGVGNLRLVMHDAIDVLAHQVPSASLARVNLYFPDPWPKKRHHKRRIIQDGFLDMIADRLTEGGTLNIATDWADYAAHVDDVFSRSTIFCCIERREHQGECPLDRPQTKFERRGLRRGYSICDWCFSKSANN